MKIKKYSLYGSPWYEEIKDPKYIIESDNYTFSVEDKDLNITSKAYYLIYTKNNIDKDLIYITIGNYCIAYIEGTYINSNLSSYNEVNKILSLKDFIFIHSKTTLNSENNYILELDKNSYNNIQYTTFVCYIFRPIKLTSNGILGIYIGFNTPITENPDSIIEKTSLSIKNLSYTGNCEKIQIYKFEDYKVFYKDRIKQILSIE